MIYTILDLEANGLLDTVTKIHCVSYCKIENKKIIEKGTLIKKEEVKNLIENSECIVGHNIIRYDLPVLKKIWGISVSCLKFDTLAVSYYLFPEENSHGLETFGNHYSVPKPYIADWENQSIIDYINRCETDVEINKLLFIDQMNYLMALYNNIEDAHRIVRYLGFKFSCLEEQEINGITVDIPLVENTLVDLGHKILQKVQILQEIMPKELGKIIKMKPKVLNKANGEISENGKKWNNALLELNLPEDIDCIREKPNPFSSPQIKTWLLSLGWKPITFKVSKNTGEKVPQVSLPFGGGICPSVQELFEVKEELKELDSLFQLNHRKNILLNFLKFKTEDNLLYSKAHGFTNTLRLQHSNPLVNLPGVDKNYGKEIRGALKARENYKMCGVDIKGLEDNTKQHYIYFFDPVYVTEMRVPGFDPHLDIGVLAKQISKEEEAFFKWADVQESLTTEEKVKYAQIKKKRTKAKITNFSATYLAGADKIAETAKISLKEAKLFHTVYWERNKAIKKVTKSVKIKKIGSQKWLFNPVSKFWYYVKNDKDIFSTLNQGTGVYVFDTFLSEVRKLLKPYSIYVYFQYHDEFLFEYNPLKIDKNVLLNILEKAMENTNNSLKLNIQINFSAQFGDNYADCH